MFAIYLTLRVGKPVSACGAAKSHAVRLLNKPSDIFLFGIVVMPVTYLYKLGFPGDISPHSANMHCIRESSSQLKMINWMMEEGACSYFLTLNSHFVDKEG